MESQEKNSQTNSRQLSTRSTSLIKLNNCKECPFAADSKPPHNPVFGIGPSEPVGILVGESPGNDEVELGKPFVGMTGKLLNYELAQVGLERDSLFVLNAVLCRPNDKTARRMAKAVKCCSGSFNEQIKNFRETKYFLLMGKWAAYAFYGRKINLEKGRGFIR